MNEGRKISIAIPTYNRPEMTIRAFKDVHYDERVKEILICDDFSSPNKLMELKDSCKSFSKVLLIEGGFNRGVYWNKYMAVFHCSSDYVILFDSDNILTKEYIDAVYSQEWHPETILAPEFARPHFDYTAYAGQIISKENARYFAFKKGFDCLANTMNFFVHRETFLAVWEAKDNIKGADSIYFMYRWLAAGFKYKVVQGMQYEHTVHDGSYFQSVANESTPMCKHYETLISQLR